MGDCFEEGSEAPEGSLRALGGDNRVWQCPRNPVGRAARDLLDSRPQDVAEKIAQGDARLFEALTFLVKRQDVLTAKQCDLILEALLDLPADRLSEVQTALGTVAVQRLLQVASNHITVAVSNILKQKRDRGFDMYA